MENEDYKDKCPWSLTREFSVIIIYNLITQLNANDRYDNTGTHREKSWEVTVKLKVFSRPIGGIIGSIGGGLSTTPDRRGHK